MHNSREYSLREVLSSAILSVVKMNKLFMHQGVLHTTIQRSDLINTNYNILKSIINFHEKSTINLFS